MLEILQSAQKYGTPIHLQLGRLALEDLACAGWPVVRLEYGNLIEPDVIEPDRRSVTRQPDRRLDLRPALRTAARRVPRPGPAHVHDRVVDY